MPLTILLVGGTGSIGRHVARRAIADGHTVRVLTRRAGAAPAGTQAVAGDLTKPDTLGPAVDGIDAVIFTHGAPYGSSHLESVDYGGVRNILDAIGNRTVRIALMTAIGLTNRAGGYSDWKRRSERLVRASGHRYTIARPGWFDMNDANQHELHLVQGERRWSRSPADGVISRAQIADVLVSSLTSDAAASKTFDLVAERGEAQRDLDPVFAALVSDTGIDGALDIDNMPLDGEPASFTADLTRIRVRRAR